MGAGPNWTPEEDAILSKSYHLEKPAVLARKIERETGSTRTPTAVLLRGRRLGLDTRKSDEEFGIQEAADALGLGRWHIDHAATKGLIKLRGRGKCRFVTLDDFDKLATLYPAPPARSMTKTQAMQRLGYSETHITRLLQAGAIRGVRRGERWFVDADHVEALVAEMKRTGETRRDWGALPRLEAEREKCREYARTRRKEARQKARQDVWYTQSDARRVLGVGRDEMRRLLETGAVRGKRENDLWLAERQHVDELAAQRLAV